MDIFTLKDYLNPKLKKIWANYYENENSIAPMFPECVLKNHVLFLSLNPSLPPFVKDVEYGFTQSNPWRFLNSKISYEENESVPHFKKFFKIQNEINENWTFLDLLYLRKSKQLDIENSYKTQNDRNFILEQAKLTLDLITEINPKLVIVANSFTEKILHDKKQTIFNFNASLDNDFVYRYNNIPFITRESKFLGSRFWDSEKNKNRYENMIKEIQRVLEITNKTSP
ncbi:hypothetical protein ACM55I_08865 [Flavobacterium sp. GB2R13]|uniref:hypothetical protein n=1 Tax=Flavobacterium algoris TaxID=3398733 RepID=UPI003A8C508A